jgi:hypothetical protein
VAVVENLKLLDSMKADVISSIQHDKKEGVKELEKVLRRIELRDSRGLLTEVMNYVLLKALWITKPVKDGALAVHKKLSDAHVEVEVGEQDRTGQVGKKFWPLTKAAAEDLDALENLMRQELLPT